MSTSTRRTAARLEHQERHDDAGPLFNVAAHTPAAPDGDEWYAAALQYASTFVHLHGSITSDDIQAWADLTNQHPPAPSFIGSLFAKLRARGLVRTMDEVQSRVPSNNARKVRVWKPGPRWGVE